MIDARYGHSLCTVAGVDHRHIRMQGEAMSSRDTKRIRQTAGELRNFYAVVSLELLQINHLNRLRIDSLVKDLQELGPLLSYVDRIRSVRCEPVISYIVFRTVGRHNNLVEFRGHDFPTYVDAAIDLLVKARIWIQAVEQFAVSLSDEAGSDATCETEMRQYLDTLPATSSDINRLRLGIYREQSWAEEIIQQGFVLPETTDDQDVHKLVEDLRLKAKYMSLPPKKRPPDYAPAYQRIQYAMRQKQDIYEQAAAAFDEEQKSQLSNHLNLDSNDSNA